MPPAPTAQAALDHFRAGHNCAQSVLLAHRDELGLDEAQARLLAAPFGAGFGATRRTCGALAAAAMVYAGRTGAFPPGDVRAKTDFYHRIQDLDRAFAAEFGSSQCGDILRAAAQPPRPDAAERTPEYYALRPCERCILAAEHLLAESTAAAGKTQAP